MVRNVRTKLPRGNYFSLSRPFNGIRYSLQITKFETSPQLGSLLWQSYVSGGEMEFGLVGLQHAIQLGSENGAIFSMSIIPTVYP